MIETSGIVKKIDGKEAIVSISGKSDCQNCKNSCFNAPKCINIKAINNLNAQPGQTVLIGMKSLIFWKSIIFVFLLPLLLFISCAVMTFFLASQYITVHQPDLLAAIVSVIFLILYFLFLGFIYKKKNKTYHFIQKIL